MQDTFAGGGEGLHVSFDCLNVDGNEAVIGGVVTKGTFFGDDLAGQRLLTAVVDNGTTPSDTPDQITFSFFEDFFELFDLPADGDCHELTVSDFVNHPFGDLMVDLTNGQVTIR